MAAADFLLRCKVHGSQGVLDILRYLELLNDLCSIIIIAAWAKGCLHTWWKAACTSTKREWHMTVFLLLPEQLLNGLHAWQRRTGCPGDLLTGSPLSHYGHAGISAVLLKSSPTRRSSPGDLPLESLAKAASY